MADYDKHLEREARELSESEFRERYCVPEDRKQEVVAQINSHIESRRHERRYKMMVIDEQQILFFLNFHRKQPGCIMLPAVGEMPADAVVEAVTYNICCRGFLCRVWSSEFDIVPDGEQAPMMDPPLFQAENMREHILVPKDRHFRMVEMIRDRERKIQAMESVAIMPDKPPCVCDDPTGGTFTLSDGKKTIGPFRFDEFPNAIPAECQQFAQASVNEVMTDKIERTFLDGPLSPTNDRYELPQTEHDKMTDFFFDSKGE